MTPRWALKRGLKWAVEWGTAISGGGVLYRRSRTFREGSRILTYHRIADNPTDSFTVEPSHFRDHVAYLADNFNVVPLDELATGLRSGDRGVEKSVAVTFDDGYKEASGFVGETLLKHRVPATIFVVTGILDEPDKATGGPFLTWDEVRDLQE
ncbi:polysaccharide deacetylase family protein, partial [Thermodesulfobacteriota bacterium]